MSTMIAPDADTLGDQHVTCPASQIRNIICRTTGAAGQDDALFQIMRGQEMFPRQAEGGLAYLARLVWKATVA